MCKCAVLEQGKLKAPTRTCGGVEATTETAVPVSSSLDTNSSDRPFLPIKGHTDSSRRPFVRKFAGIVINLTSTQSFQNARWEIRSNLASIVKSLNPFENQLHILFGQFRVMNSTFLYLSSSFPQCFLLSFMRIVSIFEIFLRSLCPHKKGKKIVRN